MKKNIVVSYPRSGTHLTLKTINPDKRHGSEWRDVMHGAGGNLQLLKGDNTKSYKSHHSSTYFPDIYKILDEYKVIYVVRDIKDVMISYWLYLNDVSKRSSTTKYYPYHDNIEDFVKDNPMQYGFYNEHFDFKSNSFIDMWNKHVDSWLKYKDKIFILRYRDLLYNYITIKSELEEYLEMRIMNKIPTKDIMKTHAGFRKGVVGDHKNYMSEELINYINNQSFENLKILDL